MEAPELTINSSNFSSTKIVRRDIFFWKGKKKNQKEVRTVMRKNRYISKYIQKLWESEMNIGPRIKK